MVGLRELSRSEESKPRLEAHVQSARSKSGQLVECWFVAFRKNTDPSTKLVFGHSVKVVFIKDSLADYKLYCNLR